MTDRELHAQMDAEAQAIASAEADEDDGAALPDHVKVSRPGHARSKVLQVRLNPEEAEALDQIAARRGLPVSTIAREELLGLVQRERAAEKRDQMLELLSLLASLTVQLLNTYEALAPEHTPTAG